MKGKKGKKSRTPSPKKVEEGSETKVEEEPLTTSIDGQMLSLGESTILNPNQLLGTQEEADTLYVPDDTSSILEDESTISKKRGVLTENIIDVALSNIGYSASGTTQVYLNISLPGYGLHDISALFPYVHLQKVDVSYNSLTDLTPLSNMKHLVMLNAANNQLQNLLDFSPPLGLKEADFSHNDIEVMPDLSAYDHLVKLHLDCNKIGQISGLLGCKSLRVLTLSHNMIEKIEGLENLKVRKLSLSYNQITEIENLESTTQLQELDLSCNSIFSLNGLESKHPLHSLNVSDNQIGEVAEISHIENIKSLRSLNFMRNPIVETGDYRKSVIFAMQHLTELDEEDIKVEEKIAAINLFDPPAEVQAALDHITHTVYHFLQPSKIYESTLPSIEMPYPMLVLTGPQASGKRELAHRLAQEFPDYFGFGISHTTRVPYPGEQDGRDYYFVTPDQFQSLVRQGCFIQTFKHNGCLYGLTLDAIENVAKEGLACVVHMEINGIRTLKNTYFEPRYVLIIPTSAEAHRERMIERGVYSEAQMDYIIKHQSTVYKEINQQHPGFFDMVISNEKLAEAYDRLRQLVMDYLGTTDLALSGDQDLPRLSTSENKDETSTHQTTLSANMRRTWSRPSYQGDSSATNDPTSAHSQMKLDSRKTPVEKASFMRRQEAAKEAIEGYSPSIYDELFRRPMVPMTAPGMLEGSPLAQATSMYQDPSFAAAIFPNVNDNDMLDERVVQQIKGTSNGEKTHSSTPDSSNASGAASSGLSGLSSARGFSDQESGRVGKQTSDSKDVINVNEQPLDLTALSDALESLKGSLKDSSRTVTPLAPRLSQDVDNWLGSGASNPVQLGTNTKPVLPPIPTGGR